MGRPNGLTRNAMTKTMTPFFTDSVNRMIAPKMPNTVPAIPKTTEERFRRNAKNQAMTASTATTGAHNIFRTNRTEIPPI